MSVLQIVSYTSSIPCSHFGTKYREGYTIFMGNSLKRIWYVVVILAVIFFFLAYFSFSSNSNKLIVSFLDVGQGDAIYIHAPNGRQMIIDGGPRGSLKHELLSQLPYGDHSIDILVVTNPDTDHFAGFIEILNEYDIGLVIEPGTSSKTKTYQEFENLIKEKRIPKLIARTGIKIILDEKEHIAYDVLFPDRNVLGWKPNDGSLVGRLNYGPHSFMFTGDATAYTESLVLAHNSKTIITSDVLKVGHHGSRTSTSRLFLDSVHPQYAIISAGKNNRYGHPHSEVINRLENIAQIIMGTYNEGTIVCTTDSRVLECI